MKGTGRLWREPQVGVALRRSGLRTKSTKPMTQPQDKFKAFTIIELLLVVAIVVILLAMFAPMMANVNYQKKLITCESVLRDLGVAMTTYTLDYNGLYPTAAEPNITGISFPHTDWHKSWWLQQGSGHGGQGHAYDLRPTYRDYLGGKLDEKMRCPFAISYFDEKPIDQRWLTPYYLYVTNNYKNVYFEYAPTESKYVANRRGQAWRPKWHPEAKFTYIASDYVWGFRGWQQEGCLSGHPAPNGYFNEHPSQYNTAPTYNLGWPGIAPFTSRVNFLDGDTSVHSFTMNANSYLEDPDQWMLNGNGGNQFLLPRDLARW